MDENKDIFVNEKIQPYLYINTSKDDCAEIDSDQIYILTWKHINNIGLHNFELNTKIKKMMLKFNPNLTKTKHLLIKKQKQK